MSSTAKKNSKEMNCNSLKNEKHKCTEQEGYRLLIPLIAKGSMNNLHRTDVVDAFRTRGIEVKFLVREDYVSLIKPIDGVRYLTCRFPDEIGMKGIIRRFLRYLRSLYPIGAVGRRETRPRTQRFRMKAAHFAVEFIARFKLTMRLVTWLEKYFYRSEVIEDLSVDDFDQLLLLGVGADGAEHETKLTWWARQKGIPHVHVIGNWDTFTSKGYPGVRVDTLLVWGPVMKRDAIALHDIPEERIKLIGAVRYDRLKKTIIEQRDAFLKRCGLDSDKKTILFAGPLSGDQYFEMLKVYECLCETDGCYQMIFRMYPNKKFMESVYVKPIIHYAKSLPGVYVSIGDPDYRTGDKEEAVLKIEQYELWHAFEYSDLVVNYFSTAALEACLFNKPVISMNYRPLEDYGWLAPPDYADHASLPHNQRLKDYGAVHRVSSREELIEAIRTAVLYPDRYSAGRRTAAEQELGVLDGHVIERLVESFCNAYREYQLAQ
jgi:hypothetical protein